MSKSMHLDPAKRSRIIAVIILVIVLSLLFAYMVYRQNVDTHYRKVLAGDFNNDSRREKVILQNQLKGTMGEITLLTGADKVVLAENYPMPDSRLYSLELDSVSSGESELIVADIGAFINGTGSAHRGYLFEYDDGKLSEVWNTKMDEAMAYQWLENNPVKILPPHFLTNPVNFIVDSEKAFHVVYQLEGRNENDQKSIGMLIRRYEYSTKGLQPTDTEFEFIH